MLEFISAAPTAHGLSDERDLVLSSRLHSSGTRSGQRLPAVAIEGDQPLSGNVDVLVPIDDSTFFVKGWMRDGEAQITRLTAVTAGGRAGRAARAALSPRAAGSSRCSPRARTGEPVDAARFVARFETRRPSRLRKAWVFEMQNETGRAVEMYALPDRRGRPRRPHEDPAQRSGARPSRRAS